MQREQPELEYVGFWARVLASFIDTVLIFAVVIPVMLTLIGPAYWQDSRLVKGVSGFLIEWILPAAAVLAFWIARGATPGKMAISARIVDARTGLPASTGQLVGRYLGYYVAMIPLFLGFLWVAFDGRKQGWHDKLAGTVVVRPVRRGVQPVRFEAAPPADLAGPPP